MLNKDNQMHAAEEAFLIVRGLSAGRGHMFRWSQFRDAYQAVNPCYGHGPRHRPYGYDSWKTTIGKVIRAWRKHGLVTRVQRGLYQITLKGLACALPPSPLYVESGRWMPGSCGAGGWDRDFPVWQGDRP